MLEKYIYNFPPLPNNTPDSLLTYPGRETNVQGLLLEEIQQAAPEAYEKRVKRLGVVNAFTDPNFAEAVRATGTYIPHQARLDGKENG